MPTNGTPRQFVLVVAHGDGFLEVFAEHNVFARVVVMPTTTSIASELLAERIIDATLPVCYRKLHFPGMLRATGLVETITADDLLHRDAELSLLRVFDQCATQRQGVAS